MNALSQIEDNLRCISNAWEELRGLVRASAQEYRLRPPIERAIRAYRECQCAWTLSMLGIDDEADEPLFRPPEDPGLEPEPFYPEPIHIYVPGLGWIEIPQDKVDKEWKEKLKEHVASQAGAEKTIEQLLAEARQNRKAKEQPLGLINSDVMKFARCAGRLMAIGELRDLVKTRNDILLPMPSNSSILGDQFGFSDEVLLEDPADPDQKYYLPRYRLMCSETDGRLEYEISLSPPGTTGVLEIGLEAYRPPGTGQKAASSLPYRHYDLAVFLVFPDRVYHFDELVRDQDTVYARLQLDNPYHFHELEQRIASPSQNARLIVRRVTEVEMRATASTLALMPVEERVEMMGILEEQKSQLLDQIAGFRKSKPAALNSDEYIQLQLLLRATKRDIAGLSAEASYYKWPYVLDAAVEPRPFAFPVQLHPYVYSVA